MIEPIHIATMGEYQLRFFRRPINDGKPDFPWHSVDDLYSCLGLNREQRRVFLRKLKEFGGTQTVATADGIVTIAPLYMAQGCIDAMVEEGRVPDSARTAYALAETEAMKQLMAHLAFGTDAWFGWMKAAVNCHA
jgi:hypothetical protein